MIPVDKVKKVIERYISLEKELSSGKIEPKLLARKSKEYSDLKNILSSAQEYVEFDKNKQDLKNIIQDKKNDKEIINLAEKELSDAEIKKEENEKKLKIFFYFQKIKTMKRIQLLRSELELEVWKLHFLLLTCSECMKKFVQKRNGKLR